MCFEPNCSLDSFGKMWGSSVVKSIFPYDMYTSIDQLLQDTQWPPAPQFRSLLCEKKEMYSLETILKLYEKIHKSLDTSIAEFKEKLGVNNHCPLNELADHAFDVDLHVYVDTWIKFEEEKRAGEMSNMHDFLCYYNRLDTELLVEAMQQYIESFLDNFGVNSNEYITLPALAEVTLWKKYDTRKYRPYSFNADFADVAQLIRSQLAGGLSAVFCRHVQLDGWLTKYDPSVHFAKNGDPFRQIISYDVNSKCIILIMSKIVNSLIALTFRDTYEFKTHLLNCFFTEKFSLTI